MGGELVGIRHQEPWWRRARRVITGATAAVVVAVGLVSIAGRVADWVSPPPRSLNTPAFDETEFVGVALPFTVDYLSWDTEAREPRQTAISRHALPGATVDGWDGTGRQWADSPAVLAVTLQSGSHAGPQSGVSDSLDSGGAGDASASGTGSVAGDEPGVVVTVRVRVMPLPATAVGSEPTEPAGTRDPAPTTTTATDEPELGTSTGPPAGGPSGGPSDGASGGPPSTSGMAPTSGSDAIPNAGGGRFPGADGAASQPRWLNLAVPLIKRDGRVVVSTSPALVGSAPTAIPAPAVIDPGTDEDAQLGRATRDIITTLVATYGAGDLTYARAVGTSFSGLNASATLDRVTAWRLATDNPAGEDSPSGGAVADGTVRAGDLTVVWALSGDAGGLRCSYRVELLRDTDRWYLASITPQLWATS